MATSSSTKSAFLPAVLYARVSSKDQEREGFSIPAQQKLLRQYADAERLTILQEFVDVETAKQAWRAGFSAMLPFLKKGADVPDNSRGEDGPAVSQYS
jgi:site-specific DNA recombinase